jgi:hypothetical protein
MRWIVGSLVFASFLSAPQDDGMVRVRSTRDFNQTVATLDSAIIERNLKIFARVDHAANARGVSMELRPTTVFIFGNPQVGTRLMQCEQTAAIDLPQGQGVPGCHRSLLHGTRRLGRSRNGNCPSIARKSSHWP